MKIGFEFNTTVSVGEVNENSVTISGTLLVEGVTRNKRLYEIDEMENIASQAAGVPIITGIKRVVGADGQMRTIHDDNPMNEIGQVTKTTFQKSKRKITFVGRIWNTPKFPDIVQKVKLGWGISIGGFVNEAHMIVDEIKGKLMKIKDMIVQHVCLIPPEIGRGQDAAQVETVNECLMLYEDEDNTLTSQELGAVIRALKDGGYL
jgi:hypothetical protein